MPLHRKWSVPLPWDGSTRPRKADRSPFHGHKGSGSVDQSLFRELGGSGNVDQPTIHGHQGSGNVAPSSFREHGGTGDVASSTFLGHTDGVRQASESLHVTTSATAVSVFRSPVKTAFPVRITALIPQGGTAGVDLILGRAGGAEIDRIGGVAAGASGSPVFVDGRLIGAVSYLFLPDAKLIGMTPIEAMLALAREPARESTSEQNDFAHHGFGPPHSPCVLPVVGGFRFDGAVHKLERALTRKLTPVPRVHVPLETGRPLEAGSPFGIGLLTGDLRMGFIGTVTLVAGDRVYGLGHPALFLGPTQLPLTEAVIYETAHGDFPQKVGDIGRVVGSILQDRAAGVFGRVGVIPKSVALEINVTDEDRGTAQHVRAEAADVAALLPSLVSSATLEVMMRAMNRVGEGTATWRWTVRLRHEAEPLVVQEMLYDRFSIAEVVASSGESLIGQSIKRGFSIQHVTLECRVTMRRIETAPHASELP